MARLANRLGLDPATITAAVLDALTGPDPDDDQRPQSIRRDGPDPDQPVKVPPNPARLAAAGYPHRPPGAHSAAALPTNPVGVHRPPPARSRACHPG